MRRMEVLVDGIGDGGLDFWVGDDGCGGSGRTGRHDKILREQIESAFISSLKYTSWQYALHTVRARSCIRYSESGLNSPSCRYLGPD